MVVDLESAAVTQSRRARPSRAETALRASRDRRQRPLPALVLQRRRLLFTFVGGYWAKVAHSNSRGQRQDKSRMAVLSTAPLQFISSIPPVTRAFTALTVICSLLYYWLWWTSDADFSVPYLVLIPGSSVFYPWTFVTSAFVEIGVVEVRLILHIPASNVWTDGPAFFNSYCLA